MCKVFGSAVSRRNDNLPKNISAMCESLTEVDW